MPIVDDDEKRVTGGDEMPENMRGIFGDDLEAKIRLTRIAAGTLRDILGASSVVITVLSEPKGIELAADVHSASAVFCSGSGLTLEVRQRLPVIFKSMAEVAERHPGRIDGDPNEWNMT